jgi:hypothetical protein
MLKSRRNDLSPCKIGFRCEPFGDREATPRLFHKRMIPSQGGLTDPCYPHCYPRSNRECHPRIDLLAKKRGLLAVKVSKWKWKTPNSTSHGDRRLAVG